MNFNIFNINQNSESKIFKFILEKIRSFFEPDVNINRIYYTIPIRN